MQIWLILIKIHVKILWNEGPN